MRWKVAFKSRNVILDEVLKDKMIDYFKVLWDKYQVDERVMDKLYSSGVISRIYILR